MPGGQLARGRQRPHGPCSPESTAPGYRRASSRTGPAGGASTTGVSASLFPVPGPVRSSALPGRRLNRRPAPKILSRRPRYPTFVYSNRSEYPGATHENAIRRPRRTCRRVLKFMCSENCLSSLQKMATATFNSPESCDSAGALAVPSGHPITSVECVFRRP